MNISTDRIGVLWFGEDRNYESYKVFLLTRIDLEGTLVHHTHIRTTSHGSGAGRRVKGGNWVAIVLQIGSDKFGVLKRGKGCKLVHVEEGGLTIKHSTS